MYIHLPMGYQTVCTPEIGHGEEEKNSAPVEVTDQLFRTEPVTAMSEDAHY
jgi:hypothetical protein